MFNIILKLYSYLNTRSRIVYILNILRYIAQLSNREKRRDACAIEKREIRANNKESREVY